MKITYSLSPKFLRDEYVRVAIRPASNQIFKVNDLETTPEIRALYEDLRYGDSASVGEADRYLTGEDALEYLQRSKAKVEASEEAFRAKKAAATAEMEQKLVSIEGGLEEEASIQIWNECCQTRQRFNIPETDRFLSVKAAINKVAEARNIRHREKNEAENKERLLRIETVEKKRIADLAYQAKKEEEFKESQRVWIEAFGDDRLKKSQVLGYDCDGAYILQRADKEHPDFVLDYRAQSRWCDCIYPSIEAMNLLDDLPTAFKIVNLTQSHEVDFDDEGCITEDCEAIVLEGYLGSCAILVRQI